MSSYFHLELNKIKKKILALGAFVEENVRTALNVVRNADLKAADEVISADREIDKAEIEIEEECLKVLALHQPVAVDLRFLITLIKMNGDLERIGDLAVNICRRVKAITPYCQAESIFPFSLMAEKTEKMLKMSLDALVFLDVEQALAVVKMDDQVDALQQKAYAGIKKAIALQPHLVDVLMEFHNISRYLERIADHTTHIAEEVIYLIEGIIIRHSKYEPSQPIMTKKSFEYRI